MAIPCDFSVTVHADFSPDSDYSTKYFEAFICLVVIAVLSLIANGVALYSKFNKQICKVRPSKDSMSTEQLTNGEAYKHIANDSRSNTNLSTFIKYEGSVPNASTGDVSVKVPTNDNFSD